jgi:uncharacterized RDD family membrane protein YckC
MHCPKCGIEVVDTQTYCAKCGNRLDAILPNIAGAANQGSSSASSNARQSKTYAGFWRRFFAYLIDYLILTTGLVLISIGLGRSGALLFLPLSLIGGWLYYALMESSRYQATLGKMALGIKVTTLGGERIGFGQASGRFFGKVVSGLTLGVGYLMAAFTEKRQALHDKMASTLVVRTSLSASEIAAAGPAAPVGAFMIILVIIAGLFFGPFGIGLLTAIAVPAYQGYTIRVQVAQGLNFADSYKTAINEAVARGQDPSTLTTDSLNLPNSTLPRYVNKINVVSGVIVIEYGGSANSQIQGKTLLLIPGRNAAGDIVWVCGRSQQPSNVQMALANAEEHTTVPDRFLPIACRGLPPG